MGARLLDGGVLLAAVLSAVLVGLLLVAPVLPQPSAFPPLPSTTPRPTSTIAPEGEQPPIGLYLLRGAFSFGPCLAIELVPQSYPLAEGVSGIATVTYWQRGMTGCDARTGELRSVEADVTRIPDEDDPGGPPIGYAVRFSVPFMDAALPGDETQTVMAELAILAAQSTETVLQAVETAPGTGQGYVLDRVPGIDPPLNPLPSSPAGP